VAALFIVSAKVLHAQESYKVVDGDSLEYGSIRIRLIDIDAPELFQYCYDENNIKHECGKRALTELKKYVNSKISCQEVSVDRYKRKLMECFDENGESINRKMILNGWALSYGDRFKDEEKLAKNQKNGIWSGRFMRPELYRALNKNQKKQ
jgi:endonuclease YncB( thermonuclease family)